MNPMKRLLAFVLALHLTAACGSSVESPDGGLLAESAARGGVTLPEPKAAAPEFVWNSLLAGEAVVTFEAADRLGLGEGGDVRLGPRRGIHVGAFADNGTPS